MELFRCPTQRSHIISGPSTSWRQYGAGPPRRSSQVVPMRRSMGQSRVTVGSVAEIGPRGECRESGPPPPSGDDIRRGLVEPLPQSTICPSLTADNIATTATRERPILRLAAKATQFLIDLQRHIRENERLLVVAASSLIMSMSHTALRPVLPIYAKGFGVGAAAVGTTLSAYALARLMMNIPSGMLADRHGRKPLLVWGPAITALGMMGCGLALTFNDLLVWRYVTGIGSALQNAGAQLFLADISTPDNRARCLGTNQAAALIGSLVGPAVGGLLADCAGLRAPFTATGIAALLAAVYGLVRLPETRNLGKMKADAAAAAAEADEARSAQPSVETPSSSGKHRSGRAAMPPWQKLLASRDFRAIALINAAMFMTANGARSVLVPLLAVKGFGLTTTVLGLLFAGMSVVTLMGVMPSSLAADRLGRKWTIVPSCIILCLSLLLMAATGRPEVFGLAIVIYAIGNAVIGSSPAAYAADVMPKDSSGLGLGIYRSAGDIGLMFGPALLGLIADATSVQTALVANAVMLGAVVGYFAITAREARHLRGLGLPSLRMLQFGRKLAPQTA